MESDEYTIQADYQVSCFIFSRIGIGKQSPVVVK